MGETLRKEAVSRMRGDRTFVSSDDQDEMPEQKRKTEEKNREKSDTETNCGKKKELPTAAKKRQSVLR